MRLEMFGIVKDKHPLMNKSIVGIRNVYLQNSSSRSPIRLVANTAPSRPDINDKQSAIALKMLKKIKTVRFQIYGNT